MANGQAFDDAVGKIKDIPPESLIGIHLVLVEEKPIAGLKIYKNYYSFLISYILGRVKIDDVEKEFRAQIRKCLDAGVLPKFLNSHQHLHLLPGIMDVTIKVANEFGIKYIRLVNEPIIFSFGKIFRIAQLLFLRFLSGLALRKIKKNGISSNDIFVGFINAGNLKPEDAALAGKLGKENKDRIVELGCHPGFESEDLEAKYKNWGVYNWRRELEIFS